MSYVTPFPRYCGVLVKSIAFHWRLETRNIPLLGGLEKNSISWTVLACITSVTDGRRDRIAIEIATTPVYSNICGNSVALNRSMSDKDRGRRQNSLGIYDRNLAEISEISRTELAGNLHISGPFSHANISLRTTPKQTKCI